LGRVSFCEVKHVLTPPSKAMSLVCGYFAHDKPIISGQILLKSCNTFGSSSPVGDSRLYEWLRLKLAAQIGLGGSDYSLKAQIEAWRLRWKPGRSD
jgi:hypothetical protein